MASPMLHIPVTAVSPSVSDTAALRTTLRRAKVRHRLVPPRRGVQTGYLARPGTPSARGRQRFTSLRRCDALRRRTGLGFAGAHVLRAVLYVQIRSARRRAPYPRAPPTATSTQRQSKNRRARAVRVHAQRVNPPCSAPYARLVLLMDALRRRRLEHYCLARSVGWRTVSASSVETCDVGCPVRTRGVRRFYRRRAIHGRRRTRRRLAHGRRHSDRSGLVSDVRMRHGRSSLKVLMDSLMGHLLRGRWRRRGILGDAPRHSSQSMRAAQLGGWVPAQCYSTHRNDRRVDLPAQFLEYADGRSRTVLPSTHRECASSTPAPCTSLISAAIQEYWGRRMPPLQGT
ncbi:hypothetical protein PYCCODRAFT_1151955 [Trametes coccinea BRFM310]|uniref:Uncharacterized protein n=1 Tax=Trametes coccinea (strain BRFM310) TaxID=1353009 RepID=A0A1Y2IZ97_TRAC3|nr:hypothetical protein PYCCODRAFT_1151955 [Trametes coccinea BRFM310]